MAITPSGISYADNMRLADVCLVTLGGTQPLDGTGYDAAETPSSGDADVHLAIYAGDRHAPAIVHTHSPEVIALSASARRSFANHPLRDHRARRPGPGRAPACASGSSFYLAAAAVEALDRPQRRSSCATTGRSPTAATSRRRTTPGPAPGVRLARTYRLALSYGEPAILSAAELDEVTAETRRRRYGERRSGSP